MHRTALDRLAKLQASERERAPRVDLLEAAAPSYEPWRPNYRLDAALSVGGSLLLGLFAAWFADFIAGPSLSPTMLVQQSWVPTFLGSEPAREPRRLAATEIARLEAPEITRLEAPESSPRELTDAAVAPLGTGATDEDVRLVVIPLLMGVCPRTSHVAVAALGEQAGGIRAANKVWQSRRWKWHAKVI